MLRVTEFAWPLPCSVLRLAARCRAAWGAGSRSVHRPAGSWGHKPCALRRHEIVGIVTEVGAGARGWKVGDRAGVGCFTRACRDCKQCKRDTDQYCPKMVRVRMRVPHAPISVQPSSGRRHDE